MASKVVEEYQNSLRQSLWELQKSNTHTDIEFRACDGSVRAHKLMLAAHNPFWKTCLQEAVNVSDEDVLVIIPDETTEAIDSLMRGLYKGTTMAVISETSNEQTPMKTKHNCRGTLKRQRKVCKTSVKSEEYTENSCDVCDKNFPDKKALTNHKLKHKPDRWKFSCDRCPPEKFMTSRAKAVHLFKVHGEQPFVCQHCGKVFSSDNNLRTHVKNVHGAEKFPCEVCGAIFGSKSYLKAHTKLKHDQSQDQSLRSCPTCDKQVRGRYYYQHIKLHAPSQWKFSCPRCGDKFMTRYKLLEHESLVHTNQPRFKCEKCESMFHTTARRSVHRKTCKGVVDLSKLLLCYPGSGSGSEVKEDVFTIDILSDRSYIVQPPSRVEK